MFKKKHLHIIVLFIVLLLMLSLPVCAFAEQLEISDDSDNVSDSSPEEISDAEEPALPSIDINSILSGTEPPESTADPITVDTSSIDESLFDSATTVMLFDAVSGDVLYEKNPDKKIYPASTTKLMSMMLAIENGIQDRNVTCTIAADDYSSDNSLMGIIRGETLPGIDLLYGMMLKSGNDAAANVAIETAGSIEAFAEMMNKKAAELGLTNSHFMNPSGVQDENHYTTGNDMKKIAMYAYQNELFMQLCGTKVYMVEPTDLCKQQRELRNTNRLITTPVSEDPTVTYENYEYAYATGMKTGYTYSANGCLVASAKKDDSHEYIVLIFNDASESGQNRWGMAVELFDFAFANYSRITPSDYIEPYTVTEHVRNIAKNDPDNGQITFVADSRAFDNQQITVSNADAEALANGSLQIKQEVNLYTVLSAPLAQGQSVGQVNYYINDRCIGQCPLVASRRVFGEGEEDLSSQNQSEQFAEHITNTDVIKEMGQNKNILWWILIPVAVIVIIIARAVYVAKSKSRLRRQSYNERRHNPRTEIYRPNQGKQTRYRNRDRYRF